MENALTHRDRIAGYALLGLSIATVFAPRFVIADQPILQFFAAAPWMAAAILLLTADSAARPNIRLLRWAAAVLFIAGFASPFIANLINSSLGA
jgi:hypothetical protein